MKITCQYGMNFFYASSYICDVWETFSLNLPLGQFSLYVAMSVVVFKTKTIFFLGFEKKLCVKISLTFLFGFLANQLTVHGRGVSRGRYVAVANSIVTGDMRSKTCHVFC